MKKRIISAALAATLALGGLGVTASANQVSRTYTLTGTLTAKTYIADGDFCTMTFVGDAGQIIEIPDYIAPIDSRATVIMDTNGTPDKSDDVPAMVTAYTVLQ